jgi:hypothetical protein
MPDARHHSRGAHAHRRSRGSFVREQERHRLRNDVLGLLLGGTERLMLRRDGVLVLEPRS